MIELTFLGTTCMVPTKERNHSGLFLTYKNEGILIDCGEGIQRQFKVAGIKLTKITKILITHWHGDHVLGLPGLIQSMASSEYEGTLEIWGPKGIKERIGKMMDAFIFDRGIALKVNEAKDTFIETKTFQIQAVPLSHGIETIGYVFLEKDRRRVQMPKLEKLGIPEGPHIAMLQEGEDIIYKGKKVRADDVTYMVEGKRIGIIADTVLCDGCYQIAKDCDILVCESSFTSEHEDKAAEYRHLTARQAGQIASLSNVGKLVLNHFSPRYKDVSVIEEDAKSVFPHVILSYDFFKLKA